MILGPKLVPNGTQMGQKFVELSPKTTFTQAVGREGTNINPKTAPQIPQIPKWTEKNP